MTVESVTESVWTRLVARAAMIVTPFIVTLVSFLGINYLDTRFNEQAASLTGVISRVDRIENAATSAGATVSGIDRRTAIVETNQGNGQRMQDAISQKLDTIVNSIGDLREKTAAISATVEAIKLRRDSVP